MSGVYNVHAKPLVRADHRVHMQREQWPRAQSKPTPTQSTHELLLRMKNAPAVKTQKRRHKCHSVVSSRRSKPPCRMLVWLSQCLSNVHSTEMRSTASVDCRDRVVTCHCRSSSMCSATEVHRALCVMTTILYWMRCWTASQ